MKSDPARAGGLAKWAGIWCLAAGMLACGSKGGSGRPDGSDGPPGAMSQSLLPSDDTFVNSANPDDNNGASASLFVGVDGHGGAMRALLRFEMPAGLQGATVSSAKLTLTLRALGNGGAGPASVKTLQSLSEAWVQGNGVGNASMTFTVGQPCSDTVSGATWNQPSCAPGVSTTWATPGGSVAATPSGQADTTGVALEGPVIWDSTVTGNGGLAADVQRWINDPTSNHGWRISSADETTASAAQRFYSAEADGTHGPTLTIVYQPAP